MQLPPIVGVIVDGSTPVTDAPVPLVVDAPQGVDAELPFTIVGSNGQPVDLTAYISITLTLRQGPTGQTLAQLPGVAVSFVSGRGKFVFTNALLQTLSGQYSFDVFTVNASSKKDQPVPNSVLNVTLSDGSA